jgi:hypothetical protein
MTVVPAVVTLDVWGVPARQIPSAVTAMLRDRSALRRTTGLTFAKLLGTGGVQSFTVTDADAKHWALLACWSQADHAHAFQRSAVIGRWQRRSTERLHVELQPLSSHGRWSGTEPFGSPTASRWDGPVAALTRARLRPLRAIAFWRASPPVAARLHTQEALSLSLGIGEAPIGLQGTFSVWRNARGLSTFAYGDPVHVEVIRRTHEVGWYAEELFARFAVLGINGSFEGRPINC